MPRAVWSGTLSFGLVTLPVRLFPATEPKDVRFHLYDAEGRRVRYRRVVEDVSEPQPRAAATFEEDEVDDEETQPSATTSRSDPVARGASSAADERQRDVAWEELARGFEDPAGGGVVLVSREELEAVRPERSRSIDVEDFVDLRDIDPVYFEKTYYVVPTSQDSLRPYALLLRAMEHAGRVGIGRFVLRTKPHLVAIRPMRGVLALETLFFGDEVRDAASLVPAVDAVDVSERELDLAERLISTLETTWDPAAYADTYREDLLRLLAEKTPSARPEPAPTEIGVPAGTAVDELMRALRESVEAAKARSESASVKPRRPRRAG